ncbi:hypothetical protein OHV66_17130 [Acinetobacter baumannii]|nr:hypothetical protein [Acinetobacter baumannii]MDN8306466.1 hypothetical protein [Acinetobacter baumannii]
MSYPGVEIVDQYLFWGRIRYFEWFRPFIKLFDETLNPDINFFKDFALSEELKVFFKALSLMKYPPSLLGLAENSFKAQPENIWKNKIQYLNEFINHIRNLMNDTGVKSLIRKRDQKISKNLKSCREFTRALFEQHGELTVFQVDLAFTPHVEDLEHNDLTNLGSSFHAHHQLELLKKNVAQFWGNRRHNKMLQQIVGRIFNFEHSVKKGFYVHAIFFIKGHPDRNFYLTCKSEITRQWQQITQNKGCTYDCNLAPRQYYKIDKGLNQSASERENLMLNIECRCKAQKFFIFKLLDSKEYRTLQKSQCPVSKSL